MNTILVCGLINIETTLKISNFPIEYTPVEYNFFGVNSSVSGVGYNIVKALRKLGDDPCFLSIIGNDIYKDIIFSDLEKDKISTKYVLPLLEQTVQSGILYDDNRRKILLDLKNIQETKYPAKIVEEVIDKTDIAIICNINFSRVFLGILKDNGKIIATDVHVISDINDDYNNDYIKYSDILFLSNENIRGNEENMIKQLTQKYNHEINVVTMGENGLLIYTKEKAEIKHFPAIKTREVVNTIGAGDALFSCFIHYYSKTKDPYYAIKLATIFASYKIGENGGAKGFLSEKELEELVD
ncbi:MAG: carbohydrate kinase family protein [Treponema sp.]|jgi:ribokinase|nr:carbohydrate kinase family protein [Treponema sp.]